MSKLTCHALTPDRWTDLAALFGANGACDGCWCMWWRHQRGEDYQSAKGATNRRRFQKLVKEGSAHGALAYADGEPVGWISFDRRTDFHRLQRARTLRCDDADEVWSLPCFYVKAGWRSRGIASALLDFAIRHLRREGAQILEAYPVQTLPNGKRYRADEAYTGTVELLPRLASSLLVRATTIVSACGSRWRDTTAGWRWSPRLPIFFGTQTGDCRCAPPLPALP